MLFCSWHCPLETREKKTRGVNPPQTKHKKFCRFSAKIQKIDPSGFLGANTGGQGFEKYDPQSGALHTSSSSSHQTCPLLPPKLAFSLNLQSCPLFLGFLEKFGPPKFVTVNVDLKLAPPGLTFNHAEQGLKRVRLQIGTFGYLHDTALIHYPNNITCCAILDQVLKASERIQLQVPRGGIAPAPLPKSNGDHS